MTETEDTPRQDLGLSTLHKPDRNWTAPIAIQASPDRLGQPHCVVTVTNTATDQVHILIDRHQQPHVLQPGQVIRDIEMLVSEVENFRRLRVERIRDGVLLPKHPLVFSVPEAEQPRPRKN